DVDSQQQNGSRLTDCSHGGDEIKRVPTTPGVIRKDASRHPEQAREVLGIKRQMEPDQEQPEVPESKARVEQTANGFRVPIVKAGEDAKKECTDERVVKVGNDKVGVRQLPVEGDHGQHHSGQARNQKLKEKSDAEKHGQFEANSASVHCAEPVENFDSR